MNHSSPSPQNQPSDPTNHALRPRVGWHAGPASFHRGQPRIAKSSTRLWALCWAARLHGTLHTRTPQPGAAVETRKVWDRRRIVRLSLRSSTSLHHLHHLSLTPFKRPFIYVSWIIAWGGAFSRGLTENSGFFGLGARCVVAALFRRPRPTMLRMVRIICLIFVGGLVNRFLICLYACFA